MRLASFLTTSLTLSRIRDLVLNEEQLIQELLSTREELNRYQQPDNIDAAGSSGMIANSGKQ